MGFGALEVRVRKSPNVIKDRTPKTVVAIQIFLRFGDGGGKGAGFFGEGGGRSRGDWS